MTVNHPLPDFLEFAVPLQIAELKAAGGPSEGAWDRARAFAWVLGPKGDQILFKGPETAKLIGELVFAIAVLAFCPGGVALFGRRYEAADD